MLSTDIDCKIHLLKEEKMLDYQALLNSVATVSRKYENVSKLSGEEFNVFKILKVQASEVRLHTAFLGELLNPKGSHGQRGTFLELFVDRFKLRQGAFNSGKAKVEVEKYIGMLNTNNTEGGRIDIVLTDEVNNQILIENKIYAHDQKNQLLRYYSYNPKAQLLYLNLFGAKASEVSCAGLTEEQYSIISYEKDIKEWLIDCRKEAVDQPALREGITQYLNLIKHLTGQSTNHMMEKEISTYLSSSYEKLDAAFTISNALNQTRMDLLAQLKLYAEKIAASLLLECSFQIDFNRKWTFFNFYRSDWKNVSIKFEFETYDSEFYYGVARHKECYDETSSLTVEIKRRLADLNGNATPAWPFWKYMDEPFVHWTLRNKEPWLAIVNGAMEDLIRSKVELLLPLIENIEGL